MNRRAFLGKVTGGGVGIGASARVGVGIGTGTGVLLAGCLDDGAASDPATLTGEQIETATAGCGGSDGEATIRFESGAVTVVGTITAETPCYEATLLSAEIDDGTLEVVVGTEAVDTDELCPQCLGAIEYEAAIAFDGGPPASVTVSHDGIDGPTEVARASP